MSINESLNLPHNRSQFISFLKTLASFSGDLSQISAPPFLLGTFSFVEFPAFWTEHPSLLVAPADEPDSEKRAFLVLKWYLSTLIRQFARTDKRGNRKKPLNSFLGELFLAKFEGDEGTTEVVSEQVSHHPPVTAFSTSNAKHNVIVQGTFARRATFKGHMTLKQIGYTLYSLPSLSETHLITLPNARLEGLLVGSPHPELTDVSYITSSSGFTSKITYSGKGWVSGKKNSFKAVMYANGNEKDVLYTISGQWSGTYVIRRGDSTQPIIETCDATSFPVAPLIVAPLEQQHPLESRRAWREVVAGIEAGDMKTVSREKNKLEEAQRQLRNKEMAEGREWKRILFTKTERLPSLEELAAVVGVGSDQYGAQDIWLYKPGASGELDKVAL